MSRIIAWFVKNPVAANLLMLVLVMGGLLALPTIRQEEFPSVDIDLIRVSIEYPGATPEETEKSICIRVEEQVEGIVDVQQISAMAVEGACVVSLELLVNSDIDAALTEVRNRVDSIDTFPEDAEEPVISKVLMNQPVLQIAISGDTDELSLKTLGQRARDEIALLPGISQVSLEYTRPFEISVEVPESALRRHGLTLDAIAEAIRGSSLDLPGGSVKTPDGEILFRSVGQAYRGQEFSDIVVITHPDGTSVTLGEIASIVDGFEDGDLAATFNGKRTVLLQVERVGDEDTLDIAAAIRPWLEDFRLHLPDGIEAQVTNDQSVDLVVRLESLLVNARSGLLLVAGLLALFLRFRLAMWVTAGVPISFLGALMLFPAWDISISTLAVMAFILVLGILVDDAIVIGESVHRRELTGEDQKSAAVAGTLDVYIPVTFGVMTSIAAFLPLVALPGHMGSFFGVIGTTAIICLVFSLIESQLILPAHLAHRRTTSRKSKPNPLAARWGATQQMFSSGLDHLGRVLYGGALRSVIEWRYTTVAVAFGILVVTAALFSSGRMRYQFFPAVEGDIVYASLTMAQGVAAETTRNAITQIEAAARKLDVELTEASGNEPIIKNIVSSLGKQLGRGGPPDLSVQVGGSHLAEISLELTPAMSREINATGVANRWRELVGPIPESVELSFIADAFSAGEAIEIRLRGPEGESLVQAAAAVRAQLATYGGVSDITDSFRAGKQEVTLSLRPEARPLGLDQRDLARQVRQAFYGEEAQRMQRGRDDVRVMVRYPESERRSLGALEEMRIRTREGVEVPFAAVAQASLGRGFASIRRADRQRVVNITAAVDRKISTPEQILTGVSRDLPRILRAFPGIEFSLEGEQREMNKTSRGLVQGFGLALLLIYALLAIPLKSYSQPLIIMSVIPFGAVGAILGHLIMGWDLVFFSILGIVALSGVVINASLVLVHYVNSRREEGADILDAVIEAGIVRFRPILLTSLTTFLGLVPLMFEPSIAARPLVPMVIALGYGVLFASTVTLLMVPCAYLILDDLGRLIAHRREATTAAPNPGGSLNSAR